LDKKIIKTISEEYALSPITAKKYIGMTEEEITRLDAPTNYKKRTTVMDDYINIIYKMLYDRQKPEIIMSYVVKSGYTGNLETLVSYIDLFAKNNFNVRFRKYWQYDFLYPEDLIIIKRTELLKYMTTKNPKAKKNVVIGQHIKIVEEKYPIVTELKNIYDEFYGTIMGKNPDRLDIFIDKYKVSAVEGFVDGILKDIDPVKNAIIYKQSQGFVEGNNNKFKLIKRILYGRANLDTLFKKSYLAFKANTPGFLLSSLLKKAPRCETPSCFSF
jgi:hypothetical protein